MGGERDGRGVVQRSGRGALRSARRPGNVPATPNAPHQLTARRRRRPFCAGMPTSTPSASVLPAPGRGPFRPTPRCPGRTEPGPQCTVGGGGDGGEGLGGGHGGHVARAGHPLTPATASRPWRPAWLRDWRSVLSELVTSMSTCGGKGAGTPQVAEASSATGGQRRQPPHPRPHPSAPTRPPHTSHPLPLASWRSSSSTISPR